jgi:hypothetical protein
MRRDGRPHVVKEISTSVMEVFGQSGIAGLKSRDDILAVTALCCSSGFIRR